MKPVLRRIGDAGEDVGQPGLRIDVVEFRRHDQTALHLLTNKAVLTGC